MKPLSRLQYTQYSQLQLSAQLLLLWQQGHRLRTVERLDLFFTLYALEDFYVEICYHPEGPGVRGLRAFPDTEGLYEYLLEPDVSRPMA